MISQSIHRVLRELLSYNTTRQKSGLAQTSLCTVRAIPCSRSEMVVWAAVGDWDYSCVNSSVG